MQMGGRSSKVFPDIFIHIIDLKINNFVKGWYLYHLDI